MNAFEYTYICGANVSIVISPNKLKKGELVNADKLDSAAVSYTLSNSTQPIYSHHTGKFDAVVLGRSIIQGSLVLNYREADYLYSLIDPDRFRSTYINNPVYNDRSNFYYYLDYNNLKPFYIYIIEGNFNNKFNYSAYILNDCYIASRGQNIYSDDQNVLEEYSFIARSYSYFKNFNEIINSSLGDSNDDLNLTPKIINKGEESVDDKSTNIENKQNQTDSKNKDAEVKVDSISTEKQKETSVENTNANIKEEVKPSVTVEVKQPAPVVENKPASTVITNDAMKDDIRNKDSVLGNDPVNTLMMTNNLLRPKMLLQDGAQSKNEKEYIRDHFGTIKDYKDGKITKDELFNKIEYELPKKYYPDADIPNLPTNIIKNARGQIIGNVLEQYYKEKTELASGTPHNNLWNGNTPLNSIVMDNTQRDMLRNIYQKDYSNPYLKDTFFRDFFPDMPDSPIKQLRNEQENSKERNRLNLEHASIYNVLNKKVDWSVGQTYEETEENAINANFNQNRLFNFYQQNLFMTNDVEMNGIKQRFYLPSFDKDRGEILNGYYYAAGIDPADDNFLGNLFNYSIQTWRDDDQNLYIASDFNKNPIDAFFYPNNTFYDEAMNGRKRLESLNDENTWTIRIPHMWNLNEGSQSLKEWRRHTSETMFSFTGLNPFNDRKDNYYKNQLTYIYDNYIKPKNPNETEYDNLQKFLKQIYIFNEGANVKTLDQLNYYWSYEN